MLNEENKSGNLEIFTLFRKPNYFNNLEIHQNLSFPNNINNLRENWGKL
jgi:hypothetical protein